MSEYTPTTEDVLRGFSAPRYKVDPRQEGESFTAWLSRKSIETLHSGRQSEMAARRWLTAHDAEVRNEALEEADAEIVRLRGIIAAAKNFTRYTENPRWALARITDVLTVTPKEVTP